MSRLEYLRPKFLDDYSPFDALQEWRGEGIARYFEVTSFGNREFMCKLRYVKFGRAYVVSTVATTPDEAVWLAMEEFKLDAAAQKG